MDKLTFFKNVKVFQGIDDEKLRTIIEKFKLIHFDKGFTIINEGEDGKGLLIIKQGAVEITKGLNQTGDEARLSILEEYDCVGEMSIFGLSSRTANVVTLSEVEVYQISGEEFLNFCYTTPIIMFNLLNTLSHRLSQTNNKIAEMVDSFIIKNRIFALSQTLSRIMHDVRVPLTSIFISTQMMTEEHPEAMEYINEISQSAEKISDIIEEIVEFVKDSSPELFFEKYASAELFHEIQTYFDSMTSLKTITLHWEISSPEYYYLDIVRFRRLMENLLRNSINALINGGNIYLSFSGKEDYIKFSIRDDGPGVLPEKIPFIFEPFKCGTPTKGKGIGLAICKKIVDDHGGVITYKKAKEGGAQFDVELPIIDFNSPAMSRQKSNPA